MTTTLLAQVIGPVIAAAGIGFIFHPKFYKKIMKDFEAHEGLTYVMGIFVMALGIVLVMNHNLWNSLAEIIISIIAWGALIKGATFLVVPNLLFAISKPMVKNAGLMKFAMAVMLAAGAYLSYVGYWM
ncbi:MAG: hypothetical protein K9L85_02930 [Candidatus Peribacteraceae bacterium]|nr:hypothetical protein [Candidatus Peribacteraceae bacterium]